MDTEILNTPKIANLEAVDAVKEYFNLDSRNISIQVAL